MTKHKVGMLIFPNLTLLDLVGAYDTFIRCSSIEVFVVSEHKHSIKAEGGLSLNADYDFEDCPDVDILFVPGGRGINRVLVNKNYMNFLKQKAERAKYITSVCTGSIILAAAGLLKGYKATTHWRSMELLKMFNVEAIKKRIVIDGNRITGGGITAGIDFGLVLIAQIAGIDSAKLIQLTLEYTPDPPYKSGSPELAEPHVLASVINATQCIFDERVSIIKKLLDEKVY